MCINRDGCRRCLENIVIFGTNKKPLYEKDNYLAGRSEINYKYEFSQNVEFKQMLSHLTSFEDSEKYFAVSDSSIGVKMTQNLSLGVSYAMDYTNKTEKEKLDKKFLTSLIVDF